MPLSFKKQPQSRPKHTTDWIQTVDPKLFESLEGHFSEHDLPWLDRKITFRPTDETAKFWQRNGFFIAENLIEHELINEYCSDWIQHNRISHSRPGGYPGPCPHMHVDSLLRIATHEKLRKVINYLIGEEMGVHLCLTGWRSTERNWHQDGYLNPDENRDHYIAVWITLDDINANSGPFEYIPGTHKLPRITRENTINKLEPHERDEFWPKHSERFLTPLFETLKSNNQLRSHRFLAKKGDVLFWHARLMHRGSAPINPDLDRKTAILHYSGIHHRSDFPTAQQYDNQGWYFPINDGKDY